MNNEKVPGHCLCSETFAVIRSCLSNHPYVNYRVLSMPNQMGESPSNLRDGYLAKSSNYETGGNVYGRAKAT